MKTNKKATGIPRGLTGIVAGGWSPFDYPVIVIFSFCNLPKLFLICYTAFMDWKTFQKIALLIFIWGVVHYVTMPKYVLIPSDHVAVLNTVTGRISGVDKDNKIISRSLGR